MAHKLFSTLKQDHKEVNSIFKKIMATEKADERKELLQTLRLEIQPHLEAEESAVYPTLMEDTSKKIRELAMEAIEEHQATKIVMAELMKCDPGDERFKAKTKVLSEMVNHHIDQEEGMVFETLEELNEDEGLSEILTSFNKAKEKAKKSIK